MVCKNKKEKIILDLISLNLIQMILTVVIIVLLTSCAPTGGDGEWIKSLTHMPKIEGSINAGFFSMHNSIYSQHCDNRGNQIWMKWDEDKQLWKKIKYNTFGCIDGEYGTGPNSG